MRNPLLTNRTVPYYDMFPLINTPTASVIAYVPNGNMRNSMVYLPTMTQEQFQDINDVSEASPYKKVMIAADLEQFRTMKCNEEIKTPHRGEMIGAALELMQLFQVYTIVKLRQLPSHGMTALGLVLCSMKYPNLGFFPTRAEWVSLIRTCNRLVGVIPNESVRTRLTNELESILVWEENGTYINYDEEAMSEWLLQVTRSIYSQLRDIEEESKNVLEYMREWSCGESRMLDLMELVW